MKKLYIIFSSTDRKTGKFIRKVTRHNYNHVAISLDNMQTLMSFSRLYVNHAMLGGFVEESPKRYFLSPNVSVKAVEIEIDNNAYAKIISKIRQMQRAPRSYVYNFASIVFYPVGMRIKRAKCYTCAEFVRDILVVAGILKNSRRSVKIAELEEELQGFGCAEGSAWDVFGKETESWGNDVYLEEISALKAYKETARRLKKVVFNH